MANVSTSRRSLEKRKSVCLPFNGPQTALGRGLRPLMAWVYRHYRPRLSEVTICWAERLTTELVGVDDKPRKAEFRFDLDRHLPYDLQQQLPEGASVKDLSAETIIFGKFEGSLEKITSESLVWMKEVESSHELGPGYRQRFVRIGDDDDPNWIIEVQLPLLRS